MTRLAILGDIHGNLPALEAVWDDLEQHEVDHVVVAGDVINWGPFSREVLEFLEERRERCSIIRGNHEFYVLDYDTDRAPAGWTDFTMPVWTHQQIGDTWRRRIAGWPDTIQLRYPDGPPVLVVHGSPRSHRDGIHDETPDADIDAMLEGHDEQTIVAAHTHFQLVRCHRGRQILNPGAVGLPLDGDVDAGYMVLTSTGDGWEPELHRVAYDREPLLARFRQQDFRDAHGLSAWLIHEEFRTCTIFASPFLRWQAAEQPGITTLQELKQRFTTDVRRRYSHEPYRRYIT